MVLQYAVLHLNNMSGSILAKDSSECRPQNAILLILQNNLPLKFATMLTEISCSFFRDNFQASMSDTARVSVAFNGPLST